MRQQRFAVPTRPAELCSGRGGRGERGSGSAGNCACARRRRLSARVLRGGALQPGAAGADARGSGECDVRAFQLRAPEPLRVPFRDQGRVQQLHPRVRLPETSERTAGGGG